MAIKSKTFCKVQEFKFKGETGEHIVLFLNFSWEKKIAKMAELNL